MQVTDEMIEKAARAMCVDGGFDPDERMPNDGPRWKYYTSGARAALSEKQAAEVKAEYSHEDRVTLASCLSWDINEITPSDVKGILERLEIEGYRLVRSALVDVPVEPVAKQWCAHEYGHQHTSWYPDGYGDRAGWEALAKRSPAKYQVVTRDLFAHPPISHRGEDSAEVIYQAVREFRLSNMCFEDGDAYCLVDLMTADGRDIADGEEQMRELALAIADAIAATRSGSASATCPNGVSE